MIGVIADDLTGAAELGAVGLRHGLRAEILVLGPDYAFPASRHLQTFTANRRKLPDLLCLSTESRSLSPRQAARRATAAARWLRSVGATWIYKKTDSVLRGHVAVELAAIMRVLGRTRALLLPANPALGRTIRGGKYFVRGRPVHRTDFARDPEYPRRTADVRQLLSASAHVPIRVLRRGEAFAPVGICVGEVSSTADVRRWVARRESDMLLAGGAETFTAALRAMNWKPQPPASANPALPTGRELFVCGSTSDACREFVEQSRRHNVSVISLPGESARQIRLPPAIRRAVAAQLNAALVTEGRALLHVGLPPLSRRGIGPRLTTHLAELAAATLHVGNVTHVFAEGGETAAALLRRMGWWRLSVTCELAPGVATLQPQGNRRLRLTIKPGSYRWPASLLAAFAVMATTAAWVSLRSALMA